jgi:hypothetical protein
VIEFAMAAPALLHIDHVQSQLAHFWRETRTAVHNEEVSIQAQVSVTYYEWLCSIAVAVDALKLLKPNAPGPPLPCCEVDFEVGKGNRFSAASRSRALPVAGYHSVATRNSSPPDPAIRVRVGR